VTTSVNASDNIEFVVAKASSVNYCAGTTWDASGQSTGDKTRFAGVGAVQCTGLNQHDE
jgi:hypothetical protein